ncbi:hypothetical protein K504DRAFT_458933 [Pleomassaria siparia CBS 279.74]|uniref:Uncharacterized protein n=1 Tax=Pleomassaria siparia CBS 279.74 TaxID=1314801 RepID=A0A6G1K151_9PLEO|nr:hypothetical protein K504DRAFT_458933 [Pleomassaria siparia CBS 279.74]
MKSCILPLRIAPRPRPICQLCYSTAQQPAYRRSFLTSKAPAPAVRRHPARQHAQHVQHALLPRMHTRRMATTIELQLKDPESNTPLSLSERIDKLKAQLADVETHMEWIFSSNKIEHETAVLQPLATLEHIANQAIAIRTRQPLPAKLNLRQSSAGAILSLDGDQLDLPAEPSRPSKPKLYTIDDLPSPSHLSRLAENLLKHEKVFISPKVLSKYVDLQRLLGRPRAIPEIFYLYAHKPIPLLGSSPPKFKKPNPKSAKQAIPYEIGARALQAAIETKDMPLCLDLIDSSYRAPAYQRHMIIKKVGPPGIVATALPLAIYMIAANLSVYSNYMDPTLFKWYAFAGMASYVLGTGTLGFVAMTTHNDKVVRVAWRSGTPLTDRWLKEDEREALDKIACAWGFKEDWRRGDEEGEEWEGLKKWVLLRGMILDMPDLLPGMNPS